MKIRCMPVNRPHFDYERMYSIIPELDELDRRWYWPMGKKPSPLDYVPTPFDQVDRENVEYKNLACSKCGKEVKVSRRTIYVLCGC